MVQIPILQTIMAKAGSLTPLATKGLNLIASLPVEEYSILLRNALCLVGNSSSGIRECEFIGVPVVNIGSRQDSRLKGKNVVNTGYHSNEIIRGVQFQISNGHYQSEYLYGNGSSGKKIVHILSSINLDINKTITY